MKAIIGAKTALGDFLASRNKYDYIIDPSNVDILRNKQFLEIVCTVADFPEKAAMAEEKDALRFEKLQEILSEVKTERFTLVTSLATVNPSDGYYNENTSLYTDVTAPNPFISHRARFEEFIQLRFGRVLTVRVPELVFSNTLRPGIIGAIPSMEKLASYPADMSHQLFYLPMIEEDISMGWKLGLSLINLAPEPLSTIEIVREFAPDAIAVLNNAPDGYVFPPLAHSLNSIHWYDPAGYICPKATVIQQIKSVLPKEIAIVGE